MKNNQLTLRKKYQLTMPIKLPILGNFKIGTENLYYLVFHECLKAICIALGNVFKSYI